MNYNLNITKPKPIGTTYQNCSCPNLREDLLDYFANWGTDKIDQILKTFIQLIFKSQRIFQSCSTRVLSTNPTKQLSSFAIGPLPRRLRAGYACEQKEP